MPALKKPAASSLDWDAFPEPPPEAANWKPDPDLIARPGHLKDSRFDKDPYAKEKRSALRRDLCFHTGGFTSISVRSISGSTSPAFGSTPVIRSAVGSWPAQIPRHLGSEHIIVKTASALDNETIAEPTQIQIAPVIPFSEALTAPRYITAPAAKMLTPNPQKTTVAKATTESMAARDFFPTKLPSSASSISRSLSPKKGGIPAWAGPLEKLLAEGDSRKPAAVSMPPHLRRAAKISNSPEGRVDTHRYGGPDLPSGTHSQFTSVEDIYAAAVEASRRVSDTMPSAVMDHEDCVDDSALAWRLTTADLGIEDAKEGLTLQENMFQDYGDKQPLSKDTTDELKLQHQRHIDVALINLMAYDLNAENRTPSAALMSMNENAFNERFAEMRSAHMEVWVAGLQASQSKLKVDLALFQARESAQFGKKSAGAPVNGHSNGD